jgi:hypothetical protein
MILSPFLARLVDAHLRAALLHDEKSTATPMFLPPMSFPSNQEQDTVSEAVV